MRILRKDVKHDTVVVLPEFLDDFWVLYNVVQKGDRVYARTTREIKTSDRYDREEKGKRVSVFLGVTVEKVMWDRNLNRLRVHGIVCEAPEAIGAVGSHHTLSVDLNSPLTVVKPKWMSYQIEQLERATEKGVAPITVIAIDDEGYCVAVLRGFGLDIKAEERANLPGKRIADERTKAFQELFKSASQTLAGVLAGSESPLVIIGLGFVKNRFVKYLEEKAPTIRGKVFDVKGVNSTGKAGIYEAMRSGVLTKTLSHVRIAEEAEAMEEVLRRLGKSRNDVTYGMTEVQKANSLGAVEELLLTDVRLREASDEERGVLEDVMRGVEEKKGKIVIISTEHEAGMKLASLGGIAALLRFPIN